MVKKLEGVFPPTITVFNHNEDLDDAGNRRSINFLIETGAHCVVSGGSTGEFVSLTDNERKKILKIVVDEVKNRVPVITGVSHNST